MIYAPGCSRGVSGTPSLMLWREVSGHCVRLVSHSYKASYELGEEKVLKQVEENGKKKDATLLNSVIEELSGVNAAVQDYLDL